jgi:hypothetical protein
LSDGTCEHISLNDPGLATGPAVCEECVKEGTTWVHLRQCMVCGHVGCCDSSPRRHARRHWHDTKHPVIRSNEPGEDWLWCYEHNAYVTPDGALK